MAANIAHHRLPRPHFDRPVKILVVVAPYYLDIADRLLAGATAEIEAVGGSWDRVDVPGALEIAPAIAIADATSSHDGYVALGCVIRGQTSHYDIVAQQSAQGLQQLGLRGLCIGNGILTVDRYEQAEERAGPQNKGGDAAAAALHLVALARRWAGERRRDVGFVPPEGEVLLAGEGDAPDTPPRAGAWGGNLSGVAK